MTVPQHIVDYLEDHLDGTLAPPSQTALLAWLHESEEHAKSVAEWLVAEVELRDAARVVNMCAVFEGMTFDPQEQSTKTIAANPPASNFRLAWLAVAASTLFVAAGAYLFITSQRESHRDLASRAEKTTKAASAESIDPSPAILGRLANCVWSEGAHQFRVGQDITEGATLDIKSGLVQLFFESGAEVILKGPCRMRVENAMLCQLSYGDVSAEVPARAAGFTIRGPSAEVIDLGTRFGFSVVEGGKSEVHVFQGEVISRRLDESGKVYGDDILLKTNQAILFPGERQEAQRLAADEAKFAVEVRPLWQRDAIEPLAVNRNIALWLRAAHGVLTDPKNNVIAWQDLAVADNRVANDAFQPNPRWRPTAESSSLNGHPAVRFNGQSYLTTTPMTTTDNQTIVVVFQHAPPRPNGKRHGGQIINYNGPPSRYLPNVYSPGVLQFGEKISGWNGPPTSIAAKAFVGRDAGGADVSTGVTVSKSLGCESPHVAVYVYNNHLNEAALYVDGEQVAEASAPTSVAITSRKVIGKHGIFNHWYFRGDLGEIIIYNAALNPARVKKLSGQLMERYGIEADRSDTL